MGTLSDVYWINQRNGNYRCLICGYQYFDGCPRAHVKDCGKSSCTKAKKKTKEAT